MAEIVSNYGLYAAYILVVLGLLLAIVLPLISAFSNPRALIGGAVGIVAIVIVFFIGWSLSGNEVVPAYANNNITETSSKFIGGALITMYILIGLAVLTIIFTEVSKIFR